jgi:site-specific DNA-methyltransferase (adenine-specific)
MRKKFLNTECRFSRTERGKDGRLLLYYDLSNVWHIPTEFHRGVLKNGNKLPSELIHKMIQYSSNEGDLISDFFLGNFTTAYAAQELNRRVTGFEINPNAFRYHVEGIDPTTGQARSEQHE